MPEPQYWHLVMYDVRDPRRLRRTAKHLEGYGVRIQYSVFRCRLSRRQAERLRWELTLILEQEDDLLIVELCPRCGARVQHRHAQEQWDEEATSFEVV